MRAKACCTSIVAGLAFIVMPALANAQNGPFQLPDDHFLCYKGKADKKGGMVIQKGTPVNLADQFQTADYEIKKLRGICNPADKNGEGIVDPNTHLTAYQIKSTGAKHVAQSVTTFDQFGPLALTTIKEDRLLVPAAKSLTMPPPWTVSAPQGANHNVDHYQCYKVKVTKGTPKFPKDVTATLDDQFAEPARLFSLKKPKLLCNPVNKNGEGIKNGEGHLVCYQSKPAKGQAKHAKLAGIQAADQFVAETAIATKKEDMLCVPALKNPPAEFCGDGEVNQGSEECDGDATPCPGQTDACLQDCTCAQSALRCGDGILELAFGEQCEADTDCAPGEACTTSCTCMDAQCPDTLLVTRFAGVGSMITNSDNDNGFTGVAHDSGIPDLAEIAYRLSAVTGTGPNSCGVATIAGLDTGSEMCRCANDNRQICDQPNQPDIDDCGGATCLCYLDAPIASVSGNFPTCSVTLISDDVTGTWNVDTGAGAMTLPFEQTTTQSSSLLKPCATCDGDVTLNDGIRDGVCNGGVDDGLACDAQHNVATFPAPGGGSYSLDCFPAGAVIVSGLFVETNYTTDTLELNAVLPCGFDDLLLCHCGRCDLDTTIPCTSNSDCGLEGPCGTASVSSPLPNLCDDPTACTDLGNGQGECQGDDPEASCDSIVRADGSGLVGCSSNADCSVEALGLDGGTCTLLEAPDCFPDEVMVSGIADPTSPFVVAADCIAPSPNNPAANIVAGYPGPALRQEQLAIELRCAGDPGSTYPACP